VTGAEGATGAYGDTGANGSDARGQQSGYTGAAGATADSGSGTYPINQTSIGGNWNQLAKFLAAAETRLQALQGSNALPGQELGSLKKLLQACQVLLSDFQDGSLAGALNQHNGQGDNANWMHQSSNAAAVWASTGDHRTGSWTSDQQHQNNWAGGSQSGQ